MNRRRWLVGYDIRDPRRLQAVHLIVRAHGLRLQLSVFLCDLSPMELVQLKSKLRDVIHHRNDSVVIIDLGSTSAQQSSAIDYLGVKPSLPDQRQTIF